MKCDVWSKVVIGSFEGKALPTFSGEHWLVGVRSDTAGIAKTGASLRTKR
jgi:hypothetical protein